MMEKPKTPQKLAIRRRRIHCHTVNVSGWNGSGVKPSNIARIQAVIVATVVIINEYVMRSIPERISSLARSIPLVMNGNPGIMKASVYKGYKRDKIEMRGDRAEMSDFPLYLNTVAGGLDCRNQAIGGFSFVIKIYALPVVEIIGQFLYLLGRYGFDAQIGYCF